jgi:hypothetical protein
MIMNELISVLSGFLEKTGYSGGKTGEYLIFAIAGRYVSGQKPEICIYKKHELKQMKNTNSKRNVQKHQYDDKNKQKSGVRVSSIHNISALHPLH